MLARVRSLARPSLLLLLLAAIPGGCGEKDPGASPKPGAGGGHGNGGMGHLEGPDRPPPEAAPTETFQDAPPTAIRLRDVSATAGITGINHSGRAGIKEFLIEAVGTGPAWLDYDGDGLLDCYIPDGDVLSNYGFEFVQEPGREGLRPLLRAKQKRAEVFRDRLWRNKGDGTFEDVTDRARIFEAAWSFGATAFDLEGDGDTDVYVSNFGPNQLWRNNGDGTFTDVAEALGAQGPAWSWTTCTAVGDLDGDGRLDLYLAQYADPAVEVDRQRAKRVLPEDTPVEAITGRDCTWRSLPAYCGPRGLEEQHDICLRQRIDGTFEDVTEAWGLRPRSARYGFTTLLFDFNDDGLLDIYVANDSVENFLWQQERAPDGTPRFRDTSDTLGIKYGYDLKPQASMGLAAGDFNRDGLFDIFATNFSHDYNNIYLGHRVGTGRGTWFFKDRGLRVMGQAVFYDLSWGCGWIDLDNDLDLDLYFGNGHVYKEIDLFSKTGAEYEQWNSLFECMDAEAQSFREVGAKGQAHAARGVDPEGLFAGDGMALKGCSRGVAFADWNNDGRMEMLVQNMNDRYHVLVNDTPTSDARRWIKLLPQQPGGNRDALGAIVEVEAGGIRQRFPVLRLTSFLGTDDPRIHVGLGAHEQCTVRVIWPGAERETSTFQGLAAGGCWRLVRGKAEAEPMALPTFAVPAGD